MPKKQIDASASFKNRFILLGASNLTLSLRLVIDLMQRQSGAPSEIFTALGHGRAYGVCSQMLSRGLPAIANCGLWPQLAAVRPHPVYALLTDIGNDILYELPPEQILRAVEWCVSQLQQQSAQIVVTNVPMDSIKQLSERRYLLFRNLFYPFCKLPGNEAVHRARIVHAGLADMAARMHFKLYEQEPAWFGLDGIHVNYWQREAYYKDILTQFSMPDGISSSNKQGFLLTWQKRPTFAFKSVFGHAIQCPQPSGRLADGSRISKY